jgi:hypothetical protein
MPSDESHKATLDDVLEELRSQRTKKKDIWDRLKEWSSTGYMWAEVDYET